MAARLQLLADLGAVALQEWCLTGSMCLFNPVDVDVARLTDDASMRLQHL